MLRDLLGFFGDVSPAGAVALLVIGFLAGTALHEYTVFTVAAVRGWYAGHHD